MSCLNSVTEFKDNSNRTFTYCLFSYFESEILVNIGSLESLAV